MIVAIILNPRSKLATARGLDSETCFSSLSEILGLEKADSDELYEAMDWLGSRQKLIENEKVRSRFGLKQIVWVGDRGMITTTRNPLLAQEKSLTREELLQATEKELEKIVAATQKVIAFCQRGTSVISNQVD